MKITDDKIKQDIEDQFQWDSRLSGSPIDIEVSERRVSLSGKVPNHMAKEAAETISRAIPGVLTVVNNITVLYPTHIAIPSDLEISSALMNAYRLNPALDDSKIHFSVDKGVVKIAGTVDSLWKAYKAENMAYDMKGVVEVVNELAVVPTETYRDEQIAQSIISAFDRNRNIDSDAVVVKVINGKVILSGTQPNWLAHQSVIDIVRYSPGVNELVNEMTIS